MFVRWKSQRRGLSATVLRSRRVGGSPRHQVVAHLATLAHDWATRPEHLIAFWLEVDVRLAGLDVDDALRTRLAELVEARVPRPERAPLRGPLDEIAVLEAARSLCHPDRHPPERAKTANFVTAGLNRMIADRRRPKK